MVLIEAFINLLAQKIIMFLALFPMTEQNGFT